MNYLDFKKIQDALNDTYRTLQNEVGEELDPLKSILQAKNDLLQAMSHSTSIDVDLLRYKSE
ncbi:hypothetical protein E1I69_02205 [Bacillus timonensis]|uniref:Uncharacterized protein n=1 Tax=Bacillus timonensis TaxID=1033734 RepID=A0A4S3PYX9_9BACI|nr:hypothetical protein [Bacillus timonensis]THE15147.1 hypothetical protein E1I69_02205 [Bacillus timonensis]